jgi:putative membrane protein
MYLAREEQGEIGDRVAQVEYRTGAQVVAAIVDKSDTYPEVPWKAFALGASIAALAVSAWVLAGHAWFWESTVLLAALGIAAAGAASALLTVAIPPLAAFFVDEARRDLEVRQYAHSLFLQHELHATRGRIGVLILISIFEHEVVVLPDSGLSMRIPRQEFGGVISAMRPLLRRRRFTAAFIAGLDELERLLLEKGFERRSSLQNELPDAIIQTRGPR